MQAAQPPRVDTEGVSSNLRSKGKKHNIPNFLLLAQFQQVRESNAVTHQIYGVVQEYIHLIKGPDRKVRENPFANELGQLSLGTRTMKWKNAAFFYFLNTSQKI